jgi:FlaG/FlaF family flagellin (archaellin)
MKKKRAVTPVIAAVILISFSVALASIVFFWIKNYTTNTGEGLGDASCRNVDFSVGDVCYSNLTGESEGGYEISFNVINYASDTNISGFLVILDYSGGFVSGDADKEIGAFASERITSDFIEKKQSIKQIRIIPKVNSKNGLFNCEKKEIIFVWREVEEC